MKKMTGIIILNYNSFECTLRCVQSILKNEKNDNYKIYIVDNASNDDSFCNLQKTYNCFDKVTLLESKKMGVIHTEIILVLNRPFRIKWIMW